MTPSEEGVLRLKRGDACGCPVEEKSDRQDLRGCRAAYVKETGKKHRKRRKRGASRCLTTAWPDDMALTLTEDVCSCSTSLEKEVEEEQVPEMSDPFLAENGTEARGLEHLASPSETKAVLEIELSEMGERLCSQSLSHYVQNSYHEGKECQGGEEFYAALDLGTNNCRLLIAQPSDCDHAGCGHFHVVDGFSRLVRLGEGISCSHLLQPEAMERTIEALKICREKLSRWNISQQRLIATEACRSTLNGEEFVARVRREAGLDLEVVDRETEARLAVAGCGSLVESGTRGAILFDIGGGSSEIALLDMSKRHSPHLAEHIIAWTSLPVGVVTLAERFGTNRVSYQDYRRMKAYVSELLYQFSERDRLGSLVKCPSFHLIGTSGTVTMLAGIHLNLKYYDRRRVDGMWLYGHEVSRICQKLLSWDIRQRAANPCIGRERADLVLAGCAILEAIRTVWPSRRLRVADRGLREGILTELMMREKAGKR